MATKARFHWQTLPQATPLGNLIRALNQAGKRLEGAISSLIGPRLDHVEPGKEAFTLSVETAAPSSPVNGMVVYADGVGWNPGSGEGFYGYQAGAWVKL